MKLFYSPGACSLASHIALREAGADFKIERVDLAKKITETGKDYRSINSKGSVPSLELGNGEVLTEGVAIMQYVADQHPDKHLAPPNGHFQRYRLQEWMNYLSTELHKGLSPLFDKSLPSEMRETMTARVRTRLDWINSKLEGQHFLLHEGFTVADSYLFTLLNWLRFFSIELSDWSHLKAFHERVAARPHVQEALGAEGLLKSS